MKKILVVVVVLIIVVAAGLYFYNNTLLQAEASIEGALAQQDCTALSATTQVYLAKLGHKDISRFDPALAECQLYQQAQSLSADTAAYQAYQDYLAKYPQGMFVAEAKEASLGARLSIIAGQLQSGEFEQVAQSLTELKALPQDVDTLARLDELSAGLYLARAKQAAGQSDFSAAQSIYLEMESWASQNNLEQAREDAQRGRVANLLAWGQSLEASGQVFDAAGLYAHAINLTSDAALREQAVGLLFANLITRAGQAKPEAAIGLYTSALGVAGSDAQRQQALEGRAQVYLGQAEAQTKASDFLSALKILEGLDASQLSAGLQQQATTLRQQAIDRLAKSSGGQSQAAMDERARALCAGEQQVALPIFGLDAAVKNIYLSGLKTEDLTIKGMTAATPSEMRVVVCVNGRQKQVDSKTAQLTIYKTVPGVWWKYTYNSLTLVGYLKKTFLAFQIFWDVSIYDAVSGEKLLEKTLDGSAPGPLPKNSLYWVSINLQPLRGDVKEDLSNQYGDPPALSELLKLMKDALAAVK